MMDQQSLVITSIGVTSLAVLTAHQLLQSKPFINGLKYSPHLHKFFLGVADYFNSLEGLGVISLDEADQDGMCQYYITGTHCISVLKAEHVRAIVLASNYRVRVPIFDDFVDAIIGTKSLIQVMGHEWKFHRKIIAKAFAWKNLASMAPTMSLIAHEFADSLLQFPPDESFDIFPLVKLATLDIIGATAFGRSFNAVRDKNNALVDSFTFLLDDMNRRMVGSPLNLANYFYSFPTAANKTYHEKIALLRGTIDNLVHERTSNPNAPATSHRDLLQFMIDAANEDNSTITKKSFSDNLLTFLFAGYDTTSVALSYAFANLAMYPHIQAKALSEIQSVLGDTDATYETAQNLKYCSAVITEALRLFPPVLLTMRSLESDLELNGYQIPKGTSVMLPIYHINRYKANWGSDADVFRPERHLEEDNIQMAAKDKGFRMMSFSGGPRNCVGMRYAMLEATIVLTVLIRRLEFTRPQDAPEVRPVVAGLVQKPEHGIWLKVRPRV